MKQPSRRLFLGSLIIVAVVLLVLDPFALVNRVFGRRAPEVPEETTAAAVETVEEHGHPPVELVFDLLAEHRAVFIGEFPQIAEHPRFLAELIRAMPARADEARTIGIDFALSEDQEMIDRVVGGARFDEELVERILFRRLAIWGYEEYVEVFRAAWDVNRELPADEQVRLIGLNVVQDQGPTQLSPEERPRGAELGEAMFPNGLPDRHMARVALEVLERDGGPVLLYAGARHAFTDFRDLEYENRMEELGFPNAARAGNILAEELGDRIVTVYLHAPWPHENRRNGLTFAAEGLIDVLLEELPEDTAPVGFPVSGTPIGEVRLSSGDYATFRESYSFGAITDAYVVLEPTGELAAATPIPEFITAENLDAAKDGFPGHLPDKAEARDINRYIARVSNNLDDILDGFD